VPRERVDVEILAHSTRGLFGLGGKRARIRATVRSASPASGDPSPNHAHTPPAPDAVLERARAVLHDIIRHVGVDAQIAAVPDGSAPRLEIGGDPSGLLIGRRGQTLDALEYLVNRIALHDEAAVGMRVTVDVDGYRVRRQQALEDQARRMSERARSSGKPISLNPLGPRDRRIVHLALQNDTAVTTRSEGEGFYRRVVIAPTAPARRSRR
jgi:spoIIIJ-associated protein